MESGRQTCLVESGFFIPTGKFRCPALEVGPHQVAQFADFLLGIELGPQIHKVQESPQAEAHHEMLAIVERENAAGVLLGESCVEQVVLALCSLLAVRKILLA